MTEDAIRTLELMGVPVYKANSEAEAECVNLLKKGIVTAVGSDDMDCLTFGCETLIKGIR
jgi:5'-3' exonuclease